MSQHLQNRYQTALSTYARGGEFGAISAAIGASATGLQRVENMYFQPSRLMSTGNFFGADDSAFGADDSSDEYDNSMSKTEANALTKVAKTQAIVAGISSFTDLVKGITTSVVSAKNDRKMLELTQAHELEMAPYSEKTTLAEAQLRREEARLQQTLANYESQKRLPLIYGIGALTVIGGLGLLAFTRK